MIRYRPNVCFIEVNNLIVHGSLKVDNHNHTMADALAELEHDIDKHFVVFRNQRYRYFTLHISNLNSDIDHVGD